MKVGVIIAAGGTGERMKAGRSKQLLDLAGKPVLARTIGLFEQLDLVEEIVVAVEKSDLEACRREIIKVYGFTRVAAVVAGGGSRAESVKNAMGALGDDIDMVLVHDGARPLFPAGLLKRALGYLEEDEIDGVVFGVPTVDTIKEAGDGDMVEKTYDRSRLWSVQTPQIFKREIMEKAYSAPRQVLAAATDDSSLVEKVGGKVKMLTGSRENIKLTTPIDMALAEQVLRRRKSGNKSKSEG